MSPAPPRSRDLECLAAVGEPCLAREEARGVGEGGAYFPQSVASGDPRSDGVVLWTRAVDPEHPGADVVLRLEVSRDEQFRRRVLVAEGLRTTSAHDHTLKVRLTRLEPRTHYYYRFVLEREGQWLGSPVGRTRTGAAAHPGLPIHFVVASYEDLLGQARPLWQRLLQREEDPDFILFADGAPREAEARPEDASIHSVSSYRHLYRTYRSNPFLQQLHARYPFMVLWDEAGEGAGPADASAHERRSNALRALFEYLPVDEARTELEPVASPRASRESRGGEGAPGRHLRLVSPGAPTQGTRRALGGRSAGVPPGLRPRGGAATASPGSTRRVARRP